MRSNTVYIYMAMADPKYAVEYSVYIYIYGYGRP